LILVDECYGALSEACLALRKSLAQKCWSY